MSLEDSSLPWPSNLPELKRLDELLRCGICYELMATAVVTSCSHNYCSLCIRKYISYKTQCPVCFMETTDQLLRPNRIIDEVIIVFPSLRDKIAKFLHPLKGGTMKTFLNGGTSDTSQEEDTSITLAQTPTRQVPVHSLASPAHSMERIVGKKNGSLTLATGRRSPPLSSQAQSSLLATPKRSPVPSSSEGGSFTSPDLSLSSPSSSRLSSCQLSIVRPSREEIESKVTCPVCMVSIPEHNINIHLDACLQRTEKAASPIKPVQMKRRPLPKLVYSLLSDKQLRQKMKEARLSLQGDRQTLIKRHQKYTLLYNAELDEARPRSPEELARQVEREESQATLQIPSVFTYNRKTDPSVIEEQQKNYVKKHKSQFAQLLADAKKRQQEAKAKKMKERSNSETTEAAEAGIQKQSSETKKQSSVLEPSQQKRGNKEESSKPSKLFSPKHSSLLLSSPSNNNFKSRSLTMPSSSGESSKSATGAGKVWGNDLNSFSSNEVEVIDVDIDEEPPIVGRENDRERERTAIEKKNKIDEMKHGNESRSDSGEKKEEDTKLIKNNITAPEGDGGLGSESGEMVVEENTSTEGTSRRNIVSGDLVDDMMGRELMKRQEKQLLCEGEENTISPDIFVQSPAASDGSCESQSLLNDQQLSSDEDDDLIPAHQPVKVDDEPEEDFVSQALSPELGRRMTRRRSKEKEPSVLSTGLEDLGPDTQVFMENESTDPDYQPSQLLTALDETEDFALPEKRSLRSRGRQRKREECQGSTSEGTRQQPHRTRAKRVCR